MRGKVKSYKIENNYGFIEGTPDVFFHRKNVVGELPNQGDMVEYEVQNTERGLSAKNVSKIMFLV